jgi:hypothetical protein
LGVLVVATEGVIIDCIAIQRSFKIIRSIMADTTTSPPAASILRTSLEAHDAAFTQLLSMIPAKYYIAQDDEEVSCAADSGRSELE